MTRSELIAAYQKGRIDRRALVKGMVALGMSATVATAMADKLRAANLQTDPVDDLYDPVDDVSELPNTGSGSETAARNWAAPAAIIGGAAAAIATRLRRPSPDDAN